MKDLDKEARELLDAAAHVNMAPHAVRLRARKRLLGALTVGSIGTTTLVAKGAWVAAPSTAVGTGAASASSLSATLVSAVMIGLSTGLVVISPASKTEAPHPTVEQARSRSTQTFSRVRKVTSAARRDAAPLPAPVASLESPVVLEQPTVAAEPTERAVLPSPVSPPVNVPLAPESASTMQSESPTAPVIASIAREIELLAQVQRAIQGGRAWMAMYQLDRYREEFPSGKLHEEASASRVVALCALGRIDEARRAADVFTRSYPGSPLRARVRGACQKPASGADPAGDGR